MGARGAKRELTVTFSGDTTNLTHAAEQSEKALGGVGKAASGPGGLLSKLTPVIDPISLLQQGMSALVSTGLDFAKAAIDDAKSSSALDGVLRKATHATEAQVEASERWISTLSVQVGVVDDELRPAYARLAASTGDTAKAQSELQLALDIAAGTGKDYNAIADAMVKANNGNVGALGKLGIAVKDANGQLLPLGTILDNARAKYGGLAETVADQDPLNKMSVAWGELQEQLGAFVVPMLLLVSNMFTDKVLPAIQGFVDFVHSQWPALKGILTPPVDSLKEAFDRLGTSMSYVVGSGTGDQSGKMWLMINASRVLQSAAMALGAMIGWLADAVRFCANMLTIAEVGWRILIDLFTGPALRAISWLVSAFEGLGTDVARIAGTVQRVWADVFNWIARAWNNTLGKLSFHIPGTGIGFDVPDIPQVPGGRAAPAGVVVNMPVGADGHAVVQALRTYGVRVGGLDLATTATR
jgi:hypothetical protein